MLIGMGQTGKGAQAIGPGAEFIFDVTGPDFEVKVLRASLEKPVIVDFWAPWCGPCKQLGPALEAAVAAAKGAVIMAKVNIDASPELAQALRIQSVPTVYAFFQGQPVDAFMGAKPASEIKAFIDRLLKLARQAQPDAIDVPEALKQAALALADGDIDTAQALYGHILAQGDQNADAWAGLVRTFIALKDLEQAKAVLSEIPDAPAKSSVVEAARTALELAGQGPSGALEELAMKVTRNPEDLQARFDLAMAEFSSGRREEAIDSLIEIIRRNREWEEAKARTQLLKFFEAIGPADPLSVAGRRKLSSVLFS